MRAGGRIAPARIPAGLDRVHPGAATGVAPLWGGEPPPPFETFIQSPDTSDHVILRGRSSTWRRVYRIDFTPTSSSYSTSMPSGPRALVRQRFRPGTNSAYR